MPEPARRRPLPDAIIQIETPHVLDFMARGVPDGWAQCTICKLVMNREMWARTACEGEKP